MVTQHDTGDSQSSRLRVVAVEDGDARQDLDELAELLRSHTPDRLESFDDWMDGMKTMQDILRKAILDSKVSAYRLAIESGVDQAAISRFVSGQRDLRLESAGKIANALGLRLTKDKRRKVNA